MDKFRDTLRFIPLLCLLVSIALQATRVSAHDGSARLILDQYEIASGQALAVRGINLGTDLVVQVNLVGANATFLLGEALCNGHGDFEQQFTLPHDLPNGVYTLQSVDTSVEGLAVLLAETEFSIRDTAAPPLNNASQIFTDVNEPARWQQPVLVGTTFLIFFIFMLPTLQKWRSKKVKMPFTNRSS